MSRFLCLITLIASFLMGAVAHAAERVVIYTSAEEYRNAYFEERLKRLFLNTKLFWTICPRATKPQS